MTLDRRTLIRGVLGGAVVSIGLPPLEIFLNRHGTAYAGTDGFPTRFGLFFWGNGNYPDRWNPTSEGEGDAWQLSEQLSPLAAFKAKMAVISGTKVLVPNEIPHFSGAGGLLSGRALDVVSTDDYTFSGPTIDQVIAAEVGGETRFRSLEFGVEPKEGISFNGPYSPNPPESSPYLLFERLFGAGFRLPGEEGIVDPTLALRRSVLDVVMEDAARMGARLGASDAARMEAHLDGIRELELRLARLEEDPPNLEACAMPAEPDADYPDIDGRPQLKAKNDAMVALATMAMACDQVRVASHCFSYPVDNFLYPDAPDGHHNLTHDEPGDQPECNKIVLHVMENFASWLSELDAIEEGDGTLLDHCAILGCSDVSLGRTHSLDDIPMVVVGGACGKLAVDTHYRSFSGENSSQVMLSLVRAMGISAASFGDGDAVATDGLSALEVL
jgi:hypothetical protein